MADGEILNPLIYDVPDNIEMDEDLDFISFLVDIYEHLNNIDFGDLEKDEIFASLSAVLKDLQYYRAFYEEEAPLGAQAARESMLEILGNLIYSVEIFWKYLETGEKECLAEGLLKINQASDSIDILWAVVEQQRFEIADILTSMRNDS